jgi:proteasome-associated ATPase
MPVTNPYETFRFETITINGDPRDRLEAENRQLRARLEELEEQPIVYGVIVEMRGDRATVVLGAGQTIERRLGPWAKQASAGMGVKLTVNGLKVLAVVNPPPGAGVVVTVDRVHAEHVEFSAQAVHRVAARGNTEVKPGDRVVLSERMEVVLRNLGPGGTAKVFEGDTGVSWDDIGGLEDAKRQLREAIEEPVKERALYARFGKRPCRGIALFGPPGCGKTMLAKAAATALAKIHGATAKATGFIYVKGPELLNKFVGESESNVRSLFASARDHARMCGYPAIVFLDEADGVLGRRGMTKWEGMERTIVPQFLAEMDGLDPSGALVLLATNRPDTLDEAFLRDGRIDRKIEVRRPTEEECVAIFGRHLQARPVEGKLGTLATRAAKDLFDARHVIGMGAGDKGERRRVTLGDRASGALVAGIVERATQRAIRRAIEAKDGEGAVTAEDLAAGVRESLAEEQALWPGKVGASAA